MSEAAVISRRVNETALPSQGSVLVIDDEAQVRASLSRCLEEDYRVLTAGSGAEALELMEREPIDVVLCDQRMPAPFA